MKRICIWVFALIIQMPLLRAQQDPVLFTINGDTVRVAEFEYIYTKNNAENADYSRASLEEYLELYKKFKLKVKAARAAGYDTIASLNRELDGYRSQLANSYLNDKAVKKELVQEIYERQDKDVDISHILIRLPSRPGPEDSLAAYEKAMFARVELMEGKSFEEVAKKYSEDPASAAQGGHIGYVTAMLPRGYYKVENAIYSMEPGEISKPVLSERGYHIIRVNDVRPARGEVEIAHILVRSGRAGEAREEARQKIEEIHSKLEAGQSFEELARQFSEDRKTAPRGGYIGFIGIGAYEEKFEDAAFSLEKDGEYSEPVESSIGFHIIKKIGEKERLPLSQVQRRIEAELSQTERLELARKALIKGIKQSSDFKLKNEKLLVFTGALDSSFTIYEWEVPEVNEEEPLFYLGGETYTVGEFIHFIQMNKRLRLQLASRHGIQLAVKKLFNAWVEESVLKYEEGRLEEKYPDFKALMREYKEGILLFEITRDKVWDKAAQDTSGLKAYYERHRNDYLWDERLELVFFRIDSVDGKTAEKIYKYASRKKAEKTLKKFGKKGIDIDYDSEKIEKSSKKAEVFPWEEGWMTDLDYNEEMRAASFTKVERIVKSEPKSMGEARGYIIADYQDELERRWVESLREKYKIELNEEAFDELVRD